jgi:hypothetical protein
MKKETIEFEFKQRIIKLSAPSSLATCLDFVCIWSTDINRAKFTRLCAGAIAVSSPPGRGLPSYDISQSDPVSFGHGAVEALLSGGASLSNVYTIGSKLLGMMAKSIPTDDEIDSAENFIEAGADRTPATV